MEIGVNERKLRRLETFKRLINLGLTMGCLGLEVAVFAYCWLAHFQFSVVDELQHYWFMGHALEITIYGVLLLLLSAMYGGMRLGYLKNVELIFSQVFATLIANIIIYGELSLMAFQLFVPKVFLLMMAGQTIIVIVYVNAANRLYRHIFPPRRLLLVHGDRPTENLRSKFESRRDKYLITRVVHVGRGLTASAGRSWNPLKRGMQCRGAGGHIRGRAHAPDKVLLRPVHPGIFAAEDNRCDSDGGGGTACVRQPFAPDPRIQPFRGAAHRQALHRCGVFFGAAGDCLAVHADHGHRHQTV